LNTLRLGIANHPVVLKKLGIFLLCSFLVQGNLFCQGIGLPPFNYFSPQDYGAGNRNWSIVEDSLGVVYVANSEGVLAYDGIDWEKLELPGNQVAYWLEKDKKGNLYVGANGEFGALERNELGRLKYLSFIGLIDERYRDFNVVWEIARTGEGVVFRSRKYMFYYLGGEIQVFTVPKGGSKFDIANSVNDVVYTRIYDLGLAKVDDQGVHLLPNTEFFADRKINGVYAFSEDKLLVATRREGLYLYDGKDIQQFQTVVDEYLLANRIYDGHHLSDGNYALATMGKGVIVISPDGKEIFRFDDSNGLGNNQSLYLREIDEQLWLGTKNGIFQMAYKAPYRKVGKELGLNGQISSICHYKENIYATCNDGLYELKREAGNAMFNPVNEQVIVDCVSTFEFEDDLYFGSLEGIFQYNGTSVKKVSSLSTRSAIKTSYAGVLLAPEFYHGLAVIYFSGKEEKGYRYEKINRRITQILDIGNDHFLIRSIEDKLYEIELSMDGQGAPQIQIVQEAQLPRNTHIIDIEEEIYFVSNNSIYQLIDGNFSKLNYELSFQYIPKRIIHTETLKNGNCFICYEDELGSFYCEKFTGNDEERLTSTGQYIYSPYKPEVIFEEELNNNIWIGTARGINVYESVKEKRIKHPQQTVIRKMIVNNDSTIVNPSRSEVIFAYNENNIQLFFTASNGLRNGKVLYQHKLEGRQNWTKWSEENVVRYNSLPSGKYDFMVRSTSPYNGIANIASVSFLIEKPWYATYGAFLVYVIGIFVLIYFFYSLRVRNLYNRQEELADLVAQTTGQLARANAMLNEKASRLEKLGEFKSRFFANVSHDLRTPIMLLSGRVELLKADENSYLSEKGESYLHKLSEDTKKLVLLTDEIKEMIKLEEGKITLNYKRVRINGFMRRIIGLFESAAEVKAISFKLITKINDETDIAADPHYLERVMYNLISNALKFSNVNGQISISLFENKRRLYVSIGDNGIGIPKEDVYEIFDRNFQANNQYQINEGLGIGLNVVKELVNMHEGKISVESKVGIGTKFTFFIPFSLRMDVPVYEELSVGEYIKARDPNAKKQQVIDPMIQLSASKENNNNLHRLLLVEDNPEVKEYILELIRNEYKVYVAQNGKEAITILEKYPIDVIVTDLMMPVMDGFQFLEGIKSIQEFKNIPVLVVSARDSKEDRYKIMQLGVNNILSKPFDRTEFGLRLKNLTEENSTSFTLSKIVDKVEGHHKEQLSKLNEIIIAHIDDSGLKVRSLASTFNLSERSFFRLIKEMTGRSPLEYMKDFRFSYALDLLQQNKVNSIKEVSHAIGMKNSTEFNKQFEKRFGVKASSFLKQKSSFK